MHLVQEGGWLRKVGNSKSRWIYRRRDEGWREGGREGRRGEGQESGKAEVSDNRTTLYLHTYCALNGVHVKGFTFRN